MEEKLAQAREIYGSDIVSTVTQLVEVSDLDGAWSLFQAEEMWEHAECLEFLYFE